MIKLVKLMVCAMTGCRETVALSLCGVCRKKKPEMPPAVNGNLQTQLHLGSWDSGLFRKGRTWKAAGIS